MGVLKTGFSAIGKLFIVMGLAGAFLVGLLGVVYLSLMGKEIQVPEIVGKNREEAEKELSALGLKMKKRADRYSEEKPNTVLEQSPKAGTTAKTGQQILVVVSQVNPESSEAPATVVKEEEETPETGTDATKKPANKNANVKKPVQASRDVTANKTAKNANSNSNKSSTANTASNSAPANTSSPIKPANTKPAATPASSPKPTATKIPTGGDTRSRKVPE